MNNELFKIIQLLSKTYYNNNKCNNDLEQKYKKKISDLLNSPRLFKKHCQSNEDILTGITEIFSEINIIIKAFKSISSSAKLDKTVDLLIELKECLKKYHLSKIVKTIQTLINTCQNTNYNSIIYHKLESYHFKNNRIPNSIKLNQIIKNNTISTIETRVKLMKIEQSIGQDKIIPLVGSLNNSYDERIL